MSATAGYALCAAALCVSLVCQAIPPSVDYPQQLAMARELRDLFVGAGSGQLVHVDVCSRAWAFPGRSSVREGLELPFVDYARSKTFHPFADHAREFNHVLVLVGRNEPTRDPRATVFGEAAVNAVELAHQGRFWLFRYTPALS